MRKECYFLNKVTKYLVIKASTAHHRQVFVCAIKVFQLAKTCSEIIAGDIFRPDACGVMFVCSRMDSGYEHVRSCGKRLQKEKEKLKKVKLVLRQFSPIQMPKGSLSKSWRQWKSQWERRLCKCVINLCTFLSNPSFLKVSFLEECKINLSWISDDLVSRKFTRPLKFCKKY